MVIMGKTLLGAPTIVIIVIDVPFFVLLYAVFGLWLE